MQRFTGMMKFLGAIVALVLTLWLSAETPRPLFKSEAERQQALERLRNLRDASGE